MKYIHIRSLKKYHPSYTDRKLKFAKIFFDMAQGDPDCEMITNEIDWSRLIRFIILELQAQKPIPLDRNYLEKKGFNLKKRPIELTIQMLQHFLEVVTEPLQNRYVEEEEEEEKDKEKEKSKIYVDWEQSTLNLWNSFCDKNLSLSKVKEITDTRRRQLKLRYTKDSFRNFATILKAIEQQPFLINGNPNNQQHKDWKVSFDWLIENDTNYIKVLEFRYKNKKQGDWKAADSDCQTCAGTGWDETDGVKKICHCRIIR